MTSWKLTVEKILSLSWGLCVSSAQSSWFTCNKQGTLILSLNDFMKNSLIEIVYIDIGSGVKIRKSVQNSLLTAFLTRKMKINHLGTWNIPFSWQTVDIFSLLPVPGKNALIENMLHTCVFKKITKIYYFWEKCKKQVLWKQISTVFSKFRWNICLSHTQTLV